MEDFNIVGKEWQNFARIINESIYIRVNNPTFNRNIGKLNLSHIWNRVLFTTPELKIKIHQEQQEYQAHNTTLVLASLSSIVEENISCRPDEAILWGRQKLVTQCKVFCYIRTW